MHGDHSAVQNEVARGCGGGPRIDVAQRVAVGLLEALAGRALGLLPMFAPPRPAAPWEWTAYLTDAAQRSVLYWDVMRRRANNAIEHEAAGQPPLLDFAYEVVVDGRTLARPCNYALLRILPPAGVSVDPLLRPLLVIDPRAGHGAGIGGFKPDSQVGEGLAAGHPVYFVAFSPDPEPGQTLRDVGAAEAIFVETVANLHPRSPKPCVIGNCQAGWAALGMAAARPGRIGTLIINGAPVSYWAGVTGRNPLRYTAGLIGGGWLTRLLADLGHGHFDGAWLVCNFESLDPANSYWGKYYHVFANVDTEGPRFLAFERWWTGYMQFNAAEIQAIVDDLFIGNRLAARAGGSADGIAIDLRKIDAPIVVFCSSGDNITPPQQALNWIADVYPDDLALRAARQTIVYLRHARAGHLGLFVSAAIAKREHREMLSACDAIAALPPGLYEMIIEDEPEDANPSAQAQGAAPLRDASAKATGAAQEAVARGAQAQRGARQVSFELRSIADLVAQDLDGRQDEALFPLVSRISECNNAIYEASIGPVIKACVGDTQAALLRQAHPLRLARALTGDGNPLMAGVAVLAGAARKYRMPVSAANPLLEWQRRYAALNEALLDTYRDCRDAAAETAFHAMYGALARCAPPARQPGAACEADDAADAVDTDGELALLREQLARGGVIDAVVRMLLLVLGARRRVGKSGLLKCTQALESYYAGRKDTPAGASVRDVVQRQCMLVHAFPDEARQALPNLLEGERERAQALKIITAVAPDVSESADERVRELWREVCGPRARAARAPHPQLS